MVFENILLFRLSLLSLFTMALPDVPVFTCGSTAGHNLVRVVVVVVLLLLLGTILNFLHFLPLEGAKGNIR